MTVLNKDENTSNQVLTPDDIVDSDTLLNAPAVAKLLSISRAQIYELVYQRKIRSVRIGRLVRFRKQDVDAYIQYCLDHVPNWD